MDELKNRQELIKFEVSKAQLIGEPWESGVGGTMQNIFIGDGWKICRPVDKLHEQENGKVAFFMAKNKKDGTENTITMKRSISIGEGENGKKIYSEERTTVSVKDLAEVMKYAAQKYKYQKEEESGFIGIVLHKAQLTDTWKEAGSVEAREYTVISLDNAGNSFLFASDKLHKLEGNEDYVKINVPLKNGKGENRPVAVAKKGEWFKNQEERKIQQLAPRKVREQSDIFRGRIENVIKEMASLGYMPAEPPKNQPPDFLYWKEKENPTAEDVKRELLCLYDWEHAEDFIKEQKAAVNEKPEQKARMEKGRVR